MWKNSEIVETFVKKMETFVKKTHELFHLNTGTFQSHKKNEYIILSIYVTTLHNLTW